MICPDMCHYVFYFPFFKIVFKRSTTINIFHICFSLGEISGFIFFALNCLLWNYQFSDTTPKIINFKLFSTLFLLSLFLFSSTWFLSLPLFVCYKTVAWDHDGTTCCHFFSFHFFSRIFHNSFTDCSRSFLNYTLLSKFVTFSSNVLSMSLILSERKTFFELTHDLSKSCASVIDFDESWISFYSLCLNIRNVFLLFATCSFQYRPLLQNFLSWEFQFPFVTFFV